MLDWRSKIKECDHSFVSRCGALSRPSHIKISPTYAVPIHLRQHAVAALQIYRLNNQFNNFRKGFTFFCLHLLQTVTWLCYLNTTVPEHIACVQLISTERAVTFIGTFHWDCDCTICSCSLVKCESPSVNPTICLWFPRKLRGHGLYKSSVKAPQRRHWQWVTAMSRTGKKAWADITLARFQGKIKLQLGIFH